MRPGRLGCGRECGRRVIVGLVAVARPVDACRISLKAVYFNRNASRRDHVALYLVTGFRQIAKKTPDREIVEARFFSLEDLPAATTPATRRRIVEIFGGAPVSPYW